MAEADLYQSGEEICNICLSEFCDPVSTPCGHNFCRSCITRHIRVKADCPTCRTKLNKGLTLRVNNVLRTLLEKAKKIRTQETKESKVEPGEVPCDKCLGGKAVKTCLDCTASFCGIHLDPHKQHRLTDLVENPSKNRCRQHDKKLKFFCWDDMVAICKLCKAHKSHHTVSLEDEVERMKARMETQNLEVKELLKRRVEKFNQMKAAVERDNEDTGEAIGSCVHNLAHLNHSIQQSSGKLLRKLHERHVAVKRPAEVLLGELQNEIADLERKSFRLDCLTNIEDPLQMIRSWSSFQIPAPQTSNWSDIDIRSSESREVRKVLDELEKTLVQEMEQSRQVFRTCCQKILAEKPKKPMRIIQDLESVPEGVRMVVIKQQYEVDVEIDPSTASNLLLLSPCFKEVQSNHLWWINGFPALLDRYAYVLGKDTLPAGRSYFEVSTEMKTGWDLGVARESLRRGNSVTPSVKNGTWVIRLRDNTKLQALGNRPVGIPLVGKLERVGVFVDREEKLLSFYDAHASRLIYSFTGCEFKGDILPFFSPCPSDAGRNFAPLVLASPHRTGTEEEREEEPTEEPPPSEEIADDSTMSCVMTVLICVLIAFLREILL